MKSNLVSRSSLFLFFFLLLGLTAGPSAWADTTVGGTISTDTTWTAAGSPYIVTSNITVKGTDGITTLSIEPGVVVKVNSSRYIKIGASSGARGALVAQGTSADPIIFTSNQAAPAPGDWGGIKFYNTTDDNTTIMAHCIVQYAGYGNQGLVFVNKAKPSISHSTFKYSSHAGIYISGTGSNDAEINCNTFVDNSYGIYCSGNALPLVTQNNFYGNTNYGLYNGSTTTTLNAEDNWWGGCPRPQCGRRHHIWKRG